MKMKHIVTFKSGSVQIYEFKTKADSIKALKNAKILSNAFHTIEAVIVSPINFPDRQYTICFDPFRVYVPNLLKEDLYDN